MHANDGKMPYRHIIVALNGSELAERVLPHVKSLTRYCGSTITLLRVVTPVEALLFAGTVLEPLTARRHAALEQTTRELHADAVRYLTSLRDRLAAGGLVVDCASPRGAASEVIVEQARDRGAELIAMTTHGRGGLTRWVFGSVAEDIVQPVPCPVLLVPTGPEG